MNQRLCSEELVFTSVLTDLTTRGQCSARVFMSGINIHPEYVSCDHLRSDLTSLLYKHKNGLCLKISDFTNVFHPMKVGYRSFIVMSTVRYIKEIKETVWIRMKDPYWAPGC